MARHRHSRRDRKPPLRGQIVQEARALFRAKFSDMDEKSGCLFLSLCVILVAQKYGLRLVPQAGSASWERVTPEQDDGICNTHFSYVWEPHSPNTQMALLMGLLPEMHVWAADPVAQEIIDLTTGDIPEQCEKLTGMDWPGNRPPDYIWHRGGDFPDGCFYEVDRVATEIAVQYMRNLVR